MVIPPMSPIASLPRGLGGVIPASGIFAIPAMS